MIWNIKKWPSSYWRVLANFFLGLAGFLGGGAIHIGHFDMMVASGISKLISSTCFDIATEKEKTEGKKDEKSTT